MMTPRPAGFLLGSLASLVLGCIFLTGCARVPQVRHVFIISIDQGAPFNLQNGEMPLLSGMAAEGAHTWEAFTIVPSLTLPSHVSMLTGVGIQKHQIQWNDFDPELGFVKTPTIFQLAKQHGLVTALYAAKLKFKTFQSPGSLDAFFVPENPKAENVARAFAKQVAALRPNLCFIHFADADSAGHNFGVRSPEKNAALADCNAALKVVRDAIDEAGLTESTVIILTADHGGHDRSAEENASRKAKEEPYQPGTHGSADASDVLIPWIAWGHGVKKNHTITSPVVTYDTAATALWLLNIPIPPDLWGRPVKDAFDPR